jgi:hypothetical protein
MFDWGRVSSTIRALPPRLQRALSGRQSRGRTRNTRSANYLSSLRCTIPGAPGQVRPEVFHAARGRAHTRMGAFTGAGSPQGRPERGPLEPPPRTHNTNPRRWLARRGRVPAKLFHGGSCYWRVEARAYEESSCRATSSDDVRGARPAATRGLRSSIPRTCSLRRAPMRARSRIFQGYFVNRIRFGILGSTGICVQGHCSDAMMPLITD